MRNRGGACFPRVAAPALTDFSFSKSESPGPAAELVFAEPRADSSCEVRGQLYIGGSPSRLECQLSWKVQHGLLPELQIDLSPAWVPEPGPIP